MGRFLMYAALGGLAFFVMSTVVLLEHGGGSIAAPPDRGGPVATSAGPLGITLHDLTMEAYAHRGRTIVTEGVLSYSTEHDRYQVFDDSNYALVIRDYARSEELSALAGQRVRVTGTFGHDRETGVYVDATSVEAVGE
jgi:hypothetical protein